MQNFLFFYNVKETDWPERAELIKKMYAASKNIVGLHKEQHVAPRQRYIEGHDGRTAGSTFVGSSWQGQHKLQCPLQKGDCSLVPKTCQRTFSLSSRIVF